jgi:DNA-binding beta-propeller fold protein YncE
MLLIVLSLWAVPALAVPAATYHLSHQYLIGGDGGWDYLSIDGENRRLYVSHGKQLDVIDADNGKIVGVVPDLPGVHGVAIVPDLERGFSSNGKDSSVSIFNTKTFKVVKTVHVNRPDFILYDAASERVFPLSKKTTVLDSKSGETVGEVDLGGEPEAAVSDGKGLLYVNLEDKAAIAVVDTLGLKTIKTYPIERCTTPHSLSYDRENKRLLVGCADGLHVVDAESGALVAGSVMCGGVDGGAFDPETKLVFESCAEGIVSVIRQLAPNSYELVQSVPTQLHAKTMAFDPKTKRIYLSTATVEWPQNTDPTAKKAPQPQVKSGTFRVLVLEP